MCINCVLSQNPGKKVEWKDYYYIPEAHIKTPEDLHKKIENEFGIGWEYFMVDFKVWGVYKLSAE